MGSVDVHHSLVEITSRKVIRPSSPTPHHHRILTLSLLDQMLLTTSYPNIIFFYTPSITHHSATTTDFASEASESCKSLQASLSKALVHFYPLAGRLKDPTSIHCNDEGAYLVEARVNCQLPDFLKQPEIKILNQFFPQNDPKTAQLTLGSVVLLVQISVFNCGGIAIAVSPSHKIADATSYYNFVRTWAAINRDQYHGLVLPEFNGASLLPPTELSIPTIITSDIKTQSLTTRRFVFDVSKIESLKAKIRGIVKEFSPTNVQLVLAIFLRCAIAASEHDHQSRPTVIHQMVNLRRRMVPEIQENIMGNWFWSLPVVVKENETELEELVSSMRKTLTSFYNTKANRFKGEDGFLVVSECIQESVDLFKTYKGANIYWSTSLCKLPIYEMDFGWGKPIWVTYPQIYENLIVLMDTKRGDGIEAWVTLDEKEMAKFECDQELLAFASLNPTTIGHPFHSRI